MPGVSILALPAAPPSSPPVGILGAADAQYELQTMESRGSANMDASMAVGASSDKSLTKRRSKKEWPLPTTISIFDPEQSRWKKMFASER